MIRSQVLLLIALLFVPLCTAQAERWLDGQVNTTMCRWDSPRAAVVRDTLYIDGGYLWWEPGMADGTYQTPIADGNPLGLVYQLNFSTPFNTTKNFNLSSIFTTFSKAAGGGGANNIGPQYFDGAMFANDFEWATYGGLLILTDAYKAQDADAYAIYQVYGSGPPKAFDKGFVLDQLPANITRYVTNGAAVSVPSENLGFYFGGLRSAAAGPIFYSPGNDSIRANYESQTMIEVDLSVQQHETWRNLTLPTTVPGRANAELVWVPYSEKGILVAIGGVIFPSFATTAQKNNASAAAQSEKISPGFMSTVAVYDIAKQTWYEQPTSGSGPGQLTQGCTVLASAQDGSSHNIYWYGGFDGLAPTGTFNDDVWVLSIPSFMWMKVKSGTPSHGRAGHKCTKPYPDQMFVVGGYSSSPGGVFTCLEGGIIQIFNLSSAEWIQSYDPNVWTNYTVPEMIYAMIGGSPSGSATQSAPAATGFADASMTAIFQGAYNTSKITTYYPYPAAETNTNNRTTLLPTPLPQKSNTPSYLAPVLGVVLGLFFLTLIIIAILLWRRRKFLRLNGGAAQSEAGTMDNRRWVTNWLLGAPSEAKAPTVTTDEMPTSTYEEEHQTYLPPTIPEMAGRQVVHELMDTSRPVELHDTGFVPVTKLGGENGNGIAHSPSAASQASTVSHISRSSAVGGRPGISPVNSPRMDSPPPGETSEEHRRRMIVSDMSISDAERGHLRGISETSVSTEGVYATPMETLEGLEVGERTGGATPMPGRQLGVSPLTPPEGMQESGDYLSSPGSQAGTSQASTSQVGTGQADTSTSQVGTSQAGASQAVTSQEDTNPKRKSNFQEGLDEAERR